jgi:uncharacterized RmlC-like cupin family protein
MRRVAIVAACIVLLATAAFAQQTTGTSGTMKSHVVFYPSEARWSPAPPGLPEGAEITVLEGDPTQAGLFTIQLKMPDGYKLSPHWHPTDERVTVVQGNLMAGMGETWEERSMREMTPGGFMMLPAKNPHYVMAKGETIVQVQAEGPFDLTYINPTDDPRKKK